MRNCDKLLSQLITISIFATLLQLVDSTTVVRLELKTEPDVVSVAENTGLKFTCAAERSAGDSKEWDDMEVAVASRAQRRPSAIGANTAHTTFALFENYSVALSNLITI